MNSLCVNLAPFGISIILRFGPKSEFIWNGTIKALKNELLKIAQTGQDPYELCASNLDIKKLQALLGQLNLEEFNFLRAGCICPETESTHRFAHDERIILRYQLNLQSPHYGFRRFSSYEELLSTCQNLPKFVTELTLPLAAIKNLTSKQCRELGTVLSRIPNLHFIDEEGNENKAHPKIFEIRGIRIIGPTYDSLIKKCPESVIGRILSINIGISEPEIASVIKYYKENKAKVIEQSKSVYSQFLSDLLELKKERSTPGYASLRSTIDNLYGSLVKEGAEFFDQKNQTKESFSTFQKHVLKSIDSAMNNEFKNHRGWHSLGAVLKGFIGILALLPLGIPALIVAVAAKEKGGFTGVFFQQPKTNSAKALKALAQKLEPMMDHIDEVFSPEFKPEVNSPR